MSRNHNIMPHNIMNYGTKTVSIRDLENPQTGTQFANSVLMYKMHLSVGEKK